MKANWFCRLIFLSLASLALANVATAQDAQRFETFGGYSMVSQQVSSSGWDTSTTVFLKRWFGVTSDFSSVYYTKKTVFPANQYTTTGTLKFNQTPATLMFGPHFTYRRSRYAPFAQALFGINDTRDRFTLVKPTCSLQGGSCSGFPGQVYSESYTKFAMAFGGGLDIALGHGVSIRPVQAEYLLRRVPDVILLQFDKISYGSENSNEFRFSTGITFHFGPHLGMKR